MKPVCSSRLLLLFFVAWLPTVAVNLHAAAAEDAIEDGDEVRKWQEAAVEFPAFPRQEDLLAFYVSAATDNRFFVRRIDAEHRARRRRAVCSRDRGGGWGKKRHLRGVALPDQGAAPLRLGTLGRNLVEIAERRVEEASVVGGESPSRRALFRLFLPRGQHRRQRQRGARRLAPRRQSRPHHEYPLITMISDKLILEFDRALRTVFAGARSQRPTPGGQLPEVELSELQRAHACGLMRVNHVGEICAQALYQGQAITSRNPALREALRGAADEETEHLA